MPITVALVEDNAGICEEVEQLVSEQADLLWTGAYRNLRSALSNIPLQAPDVTLMDVELPDGSGIEATAQLKRLLPAMQILMYTGHDDPGMIDSAINAGASGYVPKRTGSQGLLRAIRLTGQHHRPLHQSPVRLQPGFSLKPDLVP
jgi:DNA-binding NarL/FixJ family response regulator